MRRVGELDVVGGRQLSDTGIRCWSTGAVRIVGLQDAVCGSPHAHGPEINANGAIWLTSIPCADHNTICALHHVTIDPELRRTVRNNRLASSLVITLTRTRSAIPE